MKEGDPAVILADAVNQLAMVLEEMVTRPEIVVAHAQRQLWFNRIRKERERVAELIPE